MPRFPWHARDRTTPPAAAATFVARSAKNTSKERQRVFTLSNRAGTSELLHHEDRAPLPSGAILGYRHS